MKLTRAQWMVGLITVLTAVIAVVTNLATFDVPPWLRPYLWLSWPLLVLLIVLLAVISVIQVRPTSTSGLLDEDELNQIVRAVSEVEQITGVDPGLENVDNWAHRLLEWERMSKELAKMARLVDVPVDGPEPQLVATKPAQLLMRLAQALLPTLWQRGHWNALIDLAGWTYTAAIVIKDWEYAASRAHDAARTLHILERLTDCAEWTRRMDEALLHISVRSDRDNVQMALFQMKGLVARDFRGDRQQAREYLQSALSLSERIGDTERKVSLLTQLGKLEELDGQIDKAASLYKQALQEAVRIESYDLQLECYDKSARLALALGDYNQVHQWCEQQLELSREVSRVFYEARAHEGLAWVLLKSQRYQEAYTHARQALAIEEQITGPRMEAIRQLVVTVADKAMDVVPTVNGFEGNVLR
ncbi:MAG: tetratricopeptide repeat protein [Chloroflexi bacterium]|nr:tetratricopeptide repeat protein [Chloroflexota bacterium]